MVLELRWVVKSDDTEATGGPRLMLELTGYGVSTQRGVSQRETGECLSRDTALPCRLRSAASHDDAVSWQPLRDAALDEFGPGTVAPRASPPLLRRRVRS